MFVNIEIPDTLNYKVWGNQERVVLQINQTIQNNTPFLKFKVTVRLSKLGFNQILSNFYVISLNTLYFEKSTPAAHLSPILYLFLHFVLFLKPILSNYQNLLNRNIFLTFSSTLWYFHNILLNS